MTLKNQEITYRNPKIVSHSIQTALRALADGHNIQLGEASNYCIDRVPELTEARLTKLRGNHPPRYTRDGRAFVTLIWVLFAEGMLKTRRDAHDWLVTLLNATDLIEDDINADNWAKVISLFVDNVVYVEGMPTPTAQEITQVLNDRAVNTPPINDSQRQIPAYQRIFLGRDNNISDLKIRLGVIDKSSRHALTIVRGWPGVGKTALMNALIHDETLTQAFDQGVLWTILGPKADIKSTLKSWARQLGARHLLKLTDMDDLTKGLRAVLAGRDILIAVDDIWTNEQGNIIKHVIDLRHNTLLMATRFTDIATALRDHKDDVYVLQPLSEKHAIELLEILAPDVVSQYGQHFPVLAQSVENLPLALRVAGPTLQYYYENGLAIAPLFEEFETNYRLLESLAPDDRFDENTGRTPTIELLFQRSLETLSETYQRAFASLGVFRHKPATFDTKAMVRVWKKQDINDLLLTIIGRGLLEPVPSGRYYMHRTLHQYANKLIDNYDATGKFL